jgi:UDP-N-acetylglucosamine 2-epimerase
MPKVMTIVGTRPELIKMSRVIYELDKYTDHTLVHTGQNYDYELNEVFFNDLQIRKPNFFLNCKGESAIQMIASILQESEKVIKDVLPDAILLYGDTNSCLSVITAKRHKIPIFHMEAGNRCFDQRVPEELNRKVVDHLSDINLVLTEHARRYLLDEGIKGDRIIKTGSHMREVLNFYMPKIKISSILETLKLEEKKYFLVSVHREENVDTKSNLSDLLETFDALVKEFNLPVIVSTHPRTEKKLKDLNIKNKKIKFLKPFGFFDYIKLQMGAFCIVSDSGTITEETSLLNLTSITVRNMHERPEGMDHGTLIMTGLKKEKVIDSIKTVISQKSDNSFISSPITDYENPIVSKQVVRIVLSYIDFVNRTVWSKDLK